MSTLFLLFGCDPSLNKSILCLQEKSSQEFFGLDNLGGDWQACEDTAIENQIEIYWQLHTHKNFWEIFKHGIIMWSS